MEKILKKLISFQTDQNHPEEIKNCVDFVAKDLRRAGLKVLIFSYKQKLSLVAARKLKKHYQYILNGHLDVVPADYPGAFEPYVKAGRLYGRGASDMKGPISALMAIIKDKACQKTDLALMLTCDEEFGDLSAQYLVHQLGYICDCAIIPDGGTNFRLTIAEKGYLHLKFTAQGIAAHGSRPWMGDNALEKLIAVYQFLKKHIPDPISKNRWVPTVNLGRLAGGTVPNKVPSQAEMFLDFRFPKNSQRLKIIKLIKKIINHSPQISWYIISEGKPLIISKNNLYLKKIKQMAKKQNLNLEFDYCHGSSDARIFAEKNIPVLIFAPISSEAHIDYEWIDLKSLEIFRHLLKAFLLSK